MAAEKQDMTLNDLSVELQTVRDTAKQELYKVGELGAAKKELQAKLNETGSDLKTLRKLISIQREAMPGKADWVDYSVEELTDILGTHNAGQFIGVVLIDRQADKIALGLHLLNERVKNPRPTRQQTVEIKDLNDALPELMRGMVNLVAKFSQKGDAVSRVAVEQYMKQLANGMGISTPAQGR